MQSQAEGANGLVEVAMESSRIENCQRNNFNLLSSFKYKKEAAKEGSGDGDYDYDD